MNRGDLRRVAMERAGFRCELCGVPYDLEMSHLRGSGAGGSKYRDVPENVAVLCRMHHDLLDGRIMPNTRRFEMEQLYRLALDRPWKDRR